MSEESQKYDMSKIELQKYNVDTPEVEIIKACQFVELQTHLTSGAKELYLNYLTNLLHLKQQKKLFEDQNKFNKQLISTNRNLVKATWVLALVTIGLALITYFR